jgi:endonuclease
MRADFKAWLEAQQYSSGAVNAQLHRVGRVEEHYGSLDECYQNGTIRDVIRFLTYSMADERHNRPNPSKIPINGNIRNNLASYKSAVVLYGQFLNGGSRSADATSSEGASATADVEPNAQRLSLERDMQMALRRDITKLGRGLSIIDDGSERAVESGLIDVTCEDAWDGALVVIELKAGKADSRAIGQVLGYMGDLSAEEEHRSVRGILVAHEFDQRTRSAARAVPSLSLVRYRVEFSFEPEA